MEGYRSLRGGTVICKIFKANILYRFILRKMREEKVTNFIKLRQGGKIVHEYSLEFIKLSKYTPSFVTGVSDDLQEECQSAMRHYNMNISRLMVYEKRVEETRSNRKSWDDKRAKSFNGGSSKNKLEIQDKPRVKKHVSIKSLPNSKELVVIGCLTLNSRKEKVLIQKIRS